MVKGVSRTGRAWLCPALALAWLTLAAPAAAQKVGPQLQFGVEMARQGLWSEALFRFEKARRLEPGSARILNNLAVAYEAVGRFEDALETYQEAVRLDPGNRDLKRNYSQFLEFYQGFKPRGPEQEPPDDGGDPEPTEPPPAP